MESKAQQALKTTAQSQAFQDSASKKSSAIVSDKFLDSLARELVFNVEVLPRLLEISDKRV